VFNVRLYHLDDLAEFPSRNSSEAFSEVITDKEDEANKVSARILIIPPAAPRQKLHYHTHREGWMMVVSGEGKEIVEGEEFPVKANDIWFMPAMTKHRIENTGKSALRVLELFTLPHDFIEVE
jgi:mannose-6-phosphate isomerase-like protein (cupin superfamily)